MTEQTSFPAAVSSEGFSPSAGGNNSRVFKLLPRAEAVADHGRVPCQEVVETAGRLFWLDADFQSGGAWAGVGQLVEAAYLGLLEIGQAEIVEEHEYELYMVLAGHRHRIQPRYLCLTDTAVGIERTRFYPVERAYRLVHGLVGLILQWKRALGEQSRWVVMVRNFDRAQHLAKRFIAELARRTEPADRIDIFIETEQPRADMALSFHGTPVVAGAPQWITAGQPSSLALDDREAARFEADIAAGAEAVLEDKFPLLLDYHRKRGDGLAGARLAFKVLGLYNRRGYYHEAKSLITTILPYFDELVGGDEATRMGSVSEINSCLVATGDGERALQVVKALAVPHISQPHLLANMNYILAMHHLRYLEAKDTESAEQHLLEAMANLLIAPDSTEADQRVFLKAFIDNGLAFLRVRQKRYQQALELCRSAYESVTNALGEDKHLLHRSVLKYNMAQVHATRGDLEEALKCYQDAISMDPFYAEYHAESGNILQQLDRTPEAINCYARALKYSPPYPEVYLRKAICHARQEDWLDALASSAISLELSPNQPELHAARAEVLTELGEVNLALAEYDTGITLADDAAAMRVNRAVLHFNNGFYERALADMDVVIASDARNSFHYENRAAIHRAMDRQELYERDMETADRCKEFV